MFNECLEIRWKTAHFCILPLKLFFLRSSINHETHVSSPDETPRSSSKIHCCVSYFQLSSQYFIWWWNTTSHSWYITSNTTVSRPNTQAWENSRRTGFPPKWRLRHKRRNSILMTCHNLDLVSTCYWLCRVGDLHQPIRSTTKIWAVTRHQYGISALVSQTSFHGETSGGVAKCRLFSQAT